MRTRFLSVLTVIGLVLTIGGGVTLAVSQNAEAVLAADRAEIPTPLQFDAKDAHYRIMLLRDPLIEDFGGVDAQLLCDIELADGTTQKIDTSRAAIRSESDLGIELGSFDAVAGATTVTCDWRSGIDRGLWFYSVAPSSAGVGIVGIIVLVVGILLLVLGGMFLIRSRTRELTKRRPLSDEGKAAGAPPTGVSGPVIRT